MSEISDTVTHPNNFSFETSISNKEGKQIKMKYFFYL